MNCTHGGPAMNIAIDAKCPWCLQIVAERTAQLATAAGKAEALLAPVALPAAHIAANPVTPASRAAAAAPETALPPVSGAPIATPDAPVVEREQTARLVADTPGVYQQGPGEVLRSPGAPIKHARNTDPDTARDAALSVADAHKRRLYDHILALIFEHGPLTDWQLANLLTSRLGERVIATSAGKRRGELRDMGLLHDTGFRGPTETGPKKAVRWGLTPAGEIEVAA